ncbi:efflux transporter outer membrane subunit [Paraburkholderia sp. BL25I1N1]|uniref:efflux transporter outer membrane subunit n=1 Tax=Paraburkholderia sp. BL25I1N1 TaxID=1938804 RepID=UPI000D04CDC3|nr:efflux transporter outer membrane subunit [Paraburkholderia sp. BL25I1N1]PRY04452.1 multidrug efflux system outer membrane protein [Paraburkholderia sp. BL25I1N1]
MTRFGLWLLGAACVASGCTLHPQPLPDLALSGQPFRHNEAGLATEHGNEPFDPVGRLNWVSLFADQQLAGLVDAALKENLEIKVADARIARSRASLDLDNSYTLPTVRTSPSFNRNRVSGTVDDALPKRTLHNWAVPVDASYEVDLWGRLRGGVESGRDSLLAAQADADAVKLRISTEVASDYLTLRFVDFDRIELLRSIELRQTALDLINRRVKAGSAGDLDALRATTELKTASAELEESDRLRENLVDAIAVLTGKSVTDLAIANRREEVVLPSVPVGLPSGILRNRPDVYASERRLDAASLQIGIAKTAFLPSLTLTASGGFASDSLRTFLDRNSSVWGLGVSVVETLFDGGRRQAAVDSAKAGYLIAEADYRSTTLQAFRQVQDALNDIAAQRLQAENYDAASTASSQAAALSRRRYEHGYVSYFEVVDSDRSALAIKRQLIRSQQAQAVATVSLLRALGGGWSGAQPVQ